MLTCPKVYSCYSRQDTDNVSELDKGCEHKRFHIFVCIHLGYAIMQSIIHQAYDSYVRVLHIGPYITRLFHGMGTLLDIECMRSMGSTIPLGINYLRAMRMVRLQLTSRGHRYILVAAQFEFKQQQLLLPIPAYLYLHHRHQHSRLHQLQHMF